MRSDENPFSRQSRAHSEVRPGYPAALFEWLASDSRSTSTAWDCATGNGQAALGLASFFDQVQATDVSSAQIVHAFKRPNIFYSVGRAEAPAFAAASFDLIVVAQALHWFDLDRFWREVARVARPGALFCAWGYSWPASTPGVDAALIVLFREILEPFWAPNNRILGAGYQSQAIVFPYARMGAPRFEIRVTWTLERLVEYMRTWSAYKHSRHDAAALAALDRIVAKARRIAGPDEPLSIRMPLVVVAGRTTGSRGGKRVGV